MVDSPDFQPTHRLEARDIASLKRCVTPVALVQDAACDISIGARGDIWIGDLRRVLPMPGRAVWKPGQVGASDPAPAQRELTSRNNTP